MANKMDCSSENLCREQFSFYLFTLNDLKSLNSSNNQCAGLEGTLSSDFNSKMQNIDPVTILLTYCESNWLQILTSFLRPEQWSQSLFS